MEEYDAISAGPDKNGCINISMCAWQSLPYEDVFLFKSKLIKLDVSHNQLQDLPKGFGCLEMLADLNLSHNKLTSLDNLEQLKRLRILDASHNQIVDLPSNVGECHMLSTLLLNQNKIASVANNVGNLFVLETLHLHMNEIKLLPGSISEIPTLKEITCENNNALKNVPASMRKDTNAILWCLAWQLKFEKDCAQNDDKYRLATVQVQTSESLKIYKEECILRLEAEISFLKSNEYVNDFLKLKEKLEMIKNNVLKPLNCLLNRFQLGLEAKVHHKSDKSQGAS